MDFFTITMVAWLQLVSASVDDNQYNYLLRSVRHHQPSGEYLIAYRTENLYNTKINHWIHGMVKMRCHEAHQYTQNGYSLFKKRIFICTADDIKFVGKNH